MAFYQVFVLAFVITLNCSQSINAKIFQREPALVRFKRGTDSYNGDIWNTVQPSKNFNNAWNIMKRAPNTLRLQPNAPNNPVLEVLYRNSNVANSRSIISVNVVLGLSARYTKGHIRANGRVNFPNSLKKHMKDNLNAISGQDEAGHLVASQFSGPPEWYNLIPQHKGVNRNAGNKWLVTDWFSTEKEIRKFLDNCSPGGYVDFRVLVYYLKRNNNRPDILFFEAKFVDPKPPANHPVPGALLGTLNNGNSANGLPKSNR